MRFSLWTAALVVASGPVARAAVIYDNFAPGDTYGTPGIATVSFFQNVGVVFTPAAAATVTDITVAMSATSDAAITLSICANASGHPGSALAAASITVLAGDPQVYHATFDSPPSLAAGTVYWVKAAPSSGTATWWPNSTGQFGYSATLATGAWVAANGPTPVLRLEDATAPLSGACCAGAICAVTSPTACNALHTRFAGLGTACNAAGNNTTPCCKADFNQSGMVSVQDLFDFLGAWFAMNAQADINQSGGVTVQDLFDFLAAWFGGC